jgi:hypothetical protein
LIGLARGSRLIACLSLSGFGLPQLSAQRLHLISKIICALRSSFGRIFG